MQFQVSIQALREQISIVHTEIAETERILDCLEYLKRDFNYAGNYEAVVRINKHLCFIKEERNYIKERERFLENMVRDVEAATHQADSQLREALNCILSIKN